MRKLSKLLAVFLSVCVLAGLIAVFASADTPVSYAISKLHQFGYTSSTTAERVKVTFKSAENGTAAWTNNATGASGSSIDSYGLSNTPNTTDVDADIAKIIYATTENGLAEGGSSKIYMDVISGQYVIASNGLYMYDYVLYEAKFMAKDLKYIEGMKISLYTYAGSASTFTREFGGVYIVKDTNGNWFVSADREYSSEDVALSTTANEWNTITIALKLSGKVYTSGTGRNYWANTYINGQYVNTVSNETEEHKLNNHILGFMLTRYYGDTAEAGANICFDDVSERYFQDGTDTTSLNKNAFTTPDYYGVDDLFVGDVTNTSSYACRDAYYQRETPTIYIGDVGYSDVETALAELGEGETIRFYADAIISGTVPQRFEVEAHEGANVEFDSAITSSSKIISGTDSDGVTYYRVTPPSTAPVAPEAPAASRLHQFGYLTNNFKPIFKSASSGTSAWTNKADGTSGGIDSYNSSNTPLSTDSNTNMAKIIYAATNNTLAEGGSSSIYMDLTALSSGNSYIIASNGLYTYDYVLFEASFMAKDLKYIEGMKISLYTYAGNASPFTREFGGVYIVKDDNDNWFVSADREYSSNDVALSTTANEWNTITIALKLSGKVYGSGSGRNYWANTYVNGQFVNTVYNETEEHKLNNHILGFMLTRYYGDTAEAGANICFDDVSERYFTDGAETSNNFATPDYYGVDDLFAGDKSEWFKTSSYACRDAYYSYEFFPELSNIGNANGTVAAKINGKYDFTFAEAALLAAQDKDTITLNRNVVLPYVLEGITELTLDGVGTIFLVGDAADKYAVSGNKLIALGKYNVIYQYNGEEVDSGELNTNAAPTPDQVDWTEVIFGDAGKAEWLVKINDGEFAPLTDEWTMIAAGSTVIVVPAEDSIVTLTWNGLGEGAEAVRTDKYFKGSEVTGPAPVLSSEPEDVPGNNWYNLANRWGILPEVMDSDKAVDQVYAPVADLRVKISYTLGVRFFATFYIPKQLDNVTITDDTIYVNNNYAVGAEINTAASLGELKTLKDIGEYYVFTEYMDLAPTHLSRIQAIKVNYTVVYEGETYEMTDTVMVSFIKEAEAEPVDGVVYYAETVFANDGGECNSGTKLVAEFLDLYKYTNTSKASDVEAALAKMPDHGVECTCKADGVESAVGESDTSLTFNETTAPAGTQIDFRTDGNAGGFQVYLPTSFVSGYTSVKVSTLPIGGEKVGVVNNRYVDGETSYQVFDETTSSGEYTVYRPSTENREFAIYNFACVTTFKIECLNAEEVVATYTFTYSLAQYIVDSDAEAGSDIFNVFCAYKNFADAAYDFKTGK